MNFAILKLLFNRAKADFQIIPTVLSFLIADKVGVVLEWWYFLIIAVFFILHMFWSLNRGVRQEADFGRDKSKEFQEVKSDIKWIRANTPLRNPKKETWWYDSAEVSKDITRESNNEKRL